MKKTAYSVASVRAAVEKVRLDGRSLFELIGQDRQLDSKLRNKMRGQKPIPHEDLARIIESYPKFLDYLNEPEPAAAPLSEAERSNLEARVSELIEKLEGVEDFKKKFDSLLLAVAAGKADEWIARNYEESKK
jgi:hypothetical protein